MCVLLCCFTWGKSEAVFLLSMLRHWQWPRAGGNKSRPLALFALSMNCVDVQTLDSVSIMQSFNPFS